MKIDNIVHKLKNGDVQALRLVYELFYKPAFRAAYFITNDTGLAEDAVHEVFLKLQNKIEQLEEPSKLESWLCRIASNTARDIVRQRSKSTLFAEARDVYSYNQLISPETLLLINEEKRSIKEYIGHLQTDQKQVVYLKYYEEMSINEICSFLEIPAGTVKSRLIRAREEIRKLLDIEGYTSRHKLKSALDSEEGS